MSKMTEVCTKPPVLSIFRDSSVTFNVFFDRGVQSHSEERQRRENLLLFRIADSNGTIWAETILDAEEVTYIILCLLSLRNILKDNSL